MSWPVSDKVAWIEELVKVPSVQSGEPSAIMLNPIQRELIDNLDEEKVIGRYPRIFGKTTAILGYVLHKIMMGQTMRISYHGPNNQTGRRFIRSLQYAFDHLPGEIQWNKSTFTMSPTRFSVGSSYVELRTGEWSLMGRDYNLLIFDDWDPNMKTIALDRAMDYASRTVVVGTFPEDCELGMIWTGAPTNGWWALPGLSRRWEVDTMMKLCNPELRRQYDVR